MKRAAEGLLDLKNPKKRKILSATPVKQKEEKKEEEYDFLSSEEVCSDELSDAEPIVPLLKPQEVEILRNDPWDMNIRSTSWTNEYTMVLATESNSNRGCGTTFTSAASTRLPNDFFWHILSNSSMEELVRWRQVSKYFDKFVRTTSKFWQSLFYRAKWRLPHEIRNFNERYDPRYSEVVIDEKKIDWFTECRRNYLNAKRIRALVGEISEKLREVIKPFAKRRKPGGKIKQARMFNPGLTDHHLDDWEELHEFKLTNDFRELYKSMNGARFKWMPNIEDYFWPYECARPPPICFPKLDAIKVVTEKWSEFTGDCNTFACDPVTQLPTSTFKTRQNPRPQFSEDELASDGSSYSNSAQEDSAADQPDDEEGQTALLKVLDLGEYCIDANEEWDEWMIYEPVSGTIVSRDEERFRSAIVGLSIVEYLQHLCDILEHDKRAPLFFSFTDYLINAKQLKQQLSEECKEDDVAPYVDDKLTLWLGQVNGAFSDCYDCFGYISARAIKLLERAALDFAVKVFSRAQEIETSDALQADTFVNAANQLGKEQMYRGPFEKVTDPQSKSHQWLLRYSVRDQEGNHVGWYHQKPDPRIVDL